MCTVLSGCCLILQGHLSILSSGSLLTDICEGLPLTTHCDGAVGDFRLSRLKHLAGRHTKGVIVISRDDSGIVGRVTPNNHSIRLKLLPKDLRQ